MPSDGLLTPLEHVLHSSYFVDGFLPPSPAATRLPDTWKLWEDLLSEATLKVQSFTQLMSEGHGIPAFKGWRQSVQELPVLPSEPLHLDTPNLLRARQVLTFLLHFYIHSLPTTSSPIHIPPSLSIPLYSLSRRIGLPPICTYSDTIYFNYSHPPGSPADLNINCTFSSTPDEAHFYMTQLLIERRGADAMKIMHNIFEAVYHPSQSTFTSISQFLNELAVVVDDINRILCDVRNGCGPATFFNRVRPWFPGGKLIFDGVQDRGEEVEEFAGSSAAQSSTIQALDAFLGIDELTHQPDNYEMQTNGKGQSFLSRMRLYIPVDHRVVLEGLSLFGKLLRSYIIRSSSPELPSEVLLSYNSVIRSMKNFRSSHIQIATMYIVNQQKGVKPTGTGGTDLIPFLRGVRNQTMRGIVQEGVRERTRVTTL